MSNFEDFVNGRGEPQVNKPTGIEFYATVSCQVCGEEVDEQTLYPSESLLTWECPLGHKSFIENFRAF